LLRCAEIPGILLIGAGHALHALAAFVHSVVDQDLRLQRPDHVVHVHTSGTTGKALHLWISKECWEREYAFRQLHRSWGGIDIGDRIATIAGHPVVPMDRTSPPFWRENWAENQLIFSSQHITPENLKYYAEKLNQFQPELLHGYPSSLYLIALYLNSEGIYTIKPKVVFTHSESLLYYQRELLENVFSCKVYNWYGNTEMVANIVECEAGNLHVKLEHSIIEIIRSDGQPARPGEIGELICTGFGNYATPLIRYRVGDTVIPSDSVCPCGRSGPLIEKIIQCPPAMWFQTFMGNINLDVSLHDLDDGLVFFGSS